MPARFAMEVIHRLPVKAVAEAESARPAAEAENSRRITNKGEADYEEGWKIRVKKALL